MAYDSRLRITQHARDRMQQRGVSRWQIDEILRHGERRHRGDCVRVRVDETELEADADRSLINLVGIVVVLTRDERVVQTVIRQKAPKYSLVVLRHLEVSGPSFKLREAIGERMQGDSVPQACKE